MYSPNYTGLIGVFRVYNQGPERDSTIFKALLVQTVSLKTEVQIPRTHVEIWRATSGLRKYICTCMHASLHIDAHTTVNKNACTHVPHTEEENKECSHN